MKTTERDFTQAEIKIISEIMAGNEEALNHPYYPKFKEAYAKFCPKGEAHIAAVWNKLIEGYRVQLANADLAMTKTTNRDYLNTVNNNPHFLEAVEMIRDDGGLAVPAGQELALWSGGYALSLAIRKMGYCPLEGTPFGGLLDNLKVTWEWKREGGLWNILSAAFVGGYERGKRAHVYFRTVDEMSVLYEQELPMLTQDEERVIVMHPIFQQGTDTAEVGYNFDARTAMAIEVARKSNVFAYKARDLKKGIRDRGFLPYVALLEMLGRQGYAANEKVYLNYRSDKFIPPQAPFAREDEPTSGSDSQKEEREKFWKK